MGCTDSLRGKCKTMNVRDSDINCSSFFPETEKWQYLTENAVATYFHSLKLARMEVQSLKHTLFRGVTLDPILVSKPFLFLRSQGRQVHNFVICKWAFLSTNNPKSLLYGQYKSQKMTETLEKNLFQPCYHLVQCSYPADSQPSWPTVRP